MASASVLAEFRDLDETMPMSAPQLTKLVAYYDKLLNLEASKNQGKGVQAFLDARTKDEGTVRAARRRLVESGMPEERLLRFPADQVILLDEKREMEVRRDELMKVLKLPVWQVEALAGDYKPAKDPSLFADALIPGLFNVRRAQGRLDQRIALLRHVEALRLYAAEHDRRACRRSCARSPCRCPTTPSPANHSATSSTAASLTSAAVRPEAWKRKRPSTSTMC